MWVAQQTKCYVPIGLRKCEVRVRKLRRRPTVSSSTWACRSKDADLRRIRGFLGQWVFPWPYRPVNIAHTRFANWRRQCTCQLITSCLQLGIESFAADNIKLRQNKLDVTRFSFKRVLIFSYASVEVDASWVESNWDLHVNPKIPSIYSTIHLRA